MRVISGVAKGRSLKAPFGASVLRPTADKVREAIFDVIGPEIEGSAFLDLFCGTGAMGIEALSRGARSAVFVDNKSSSIDLVRENLSKCGFEQNFEIIQCDVLQAIQSLSNRQRKFRYVFVDPPYSSDLISKTLEAVTIGSLLLPEARVLVEHSVKKPVPEKVSALIIHKEYKFGDTVINSYHCMEV